MMSSYRSSIRPKAAALLGSMVMVCSSLFAQGQQPSPLQSVVLSAMEVSVGNVGTVDGSGPAQGGTPANATCEGAIVSTLTMGMPVTVTGDNTGAQVDPVFGSFLVWEAFSIPACADVSVGYCGTAPPFAGALITLAVGCPLTNLVFNSANNIQPNACGDGNFTILFPALPAGTYYFPVLRGPGSEGPYTLTFEATACAGTAPANAVCAGAIPLVSAPECTPVAGDVALATLSGATGLGCGNGDVADGVWYAFEATENAATITVAPSAQFNAHFEVFEGTCGALSSIACSVGANFGVATGTTVTGLSVGSTYYIRVNDWYSGSPITTTFFICLEAVSSVDCDADAGTLVANSSIVCYNGEPVNVSATVGGDAVVPPGFLTLYFLTTGPDLLIVQGALTPAFDVVAPGVYTMHTLVYDPATLDLNGLVFGVTTGVEVNALLLQGGGSICASLDVAGAPVTVQVCVPCAANAGTITGDAGTACFEGDPVTISATPNGNATVPDGYETVYVLTTGPNLLIVQANAAPSFVVTATGQYRIHTLVYDPLTLDLGIVEFGVTNGGAINALLVQGGGSICGSLDVTGAVVTVASCCEAVAGTLQANANTVCFVNGTATFDATPNDDSVVPAGYTTLYFLTSGPDLVVVQGAFSPAFTVLSTGTYTMHTLVYDPETLDLGGLVFGQTTGAEVNAMLIQGGGQVCASLNLVGTPVVVADCSPVNDDCANAIELPINAEGNCPNAAYTGSNRYATQGLGNDPGCDVLNASFADMWYMFNSGDNTEVTLYFDEGTMTHWGVTVSDACNGNELLCEVLPAAPLVITTTVNTMYWVRVYSNLNIGTGGFFSICLSGATPTFVCDGGSVTTSGGTDIIICQDAQPDVIVLSTTSTSVEGYSYVVTDEDNIIVTLVDGNSLDFDALPLGTYRVWGVSYNGTLEGTTPGGLATEITSTGSCLELSSDHVTVIVEICSGVATSGTGSWNLFPNPSTGDFSVRSPITAGAAIIEIVDMKGRIVLQQQAMLTNGEVYVVNAAGKLAEGLYTVRVQAAGTTESLRLVVQ